MSTEGGAFFMETQRNIFFHRKEADFENRLMLFENIGAIRVGLILVRGIVFQLEDKVFPGIGVSYGLQEKVETSLQ